MENKKEHHESKKTNTGKLGRNSPTHPRRLKAADNENRALELRMAGANYHQIADQIGTTYSLAYNTVRRALERIARENTAMADKVRDLEAARYDRLMASWWPRALGSASKAPDPKAAAIVMDIIHRRCKLFGADAPKKIALTEADGTPVDPTTIRDELVARFARLVETNEGADCGGDQDDEGFGGGEPPESLADLGEAEPAGT